VNSNNLEEKERLRVEELLRSTLLSRLETGLEEDLEEKTTTGLTS